MKPYLFDATLTLRNELSWADVFSLLNASIGFSAILLVINGSIDLALRVIFIAGVADGMDGKLARKTRGSTFGENLDSLADSISFSLVPGLILASLGPPSISIRHLAGLIFLLAGIVRLARFNVSNIEKKRFSGLPSTGAGLTLVTILLIYGTSPLLIAITLFFSFLMVSNLVYPKASGIKSLPVGLLLIFSAWSPHIFNQIFPKLLLLIMSIYISLGLIYLIIPEKIKEIL